MNYRQVTLLPSTSLGASGVKIIDLNLRDPVSRLLFYLEVTTGGGNFTKHISEALTKVELIDGSEVLMSVPGSVLDSIPYFTGQPVTIDKHGWEQSTTHKARLYYDFGRFLYDPKYAFDPAKLTNPQLRLTFDGTNVEANATDVTLQVEGLVFDDRIVQASHYLGVKQLIEWSPGNNEWKYVQMPTDYPYRLLLVQAYNPGKAIDDILSNIRLSEDQDKRIPYDVGAAELAKNNAIDYGRVYDQAEGDAQTSDRDYMSRVGKLMAVGHAAATEANLDNITITEAAKVTIGASTGSFALSLILSGFCPHSIVSLPVGHPADENDWYNVGGLGSLELQLKSGGSASSNAGNPKIYVQQGRSY